MVVAQKTEEAEITEQDSLLLTRNLLRIAIYNISYIRGLFPEKHFSDKSVPALEMKIKKLMPMDAESRRLIDWMEKGVYDALQKKYLKTLLFCICEEEEGPMIEEYAFSFSYPNTSTEEVAMNLSRSGSKKGSTTFTSNASEVTPDQMRISACKMIRTLVSLMRTLDPMPEERTIIMKLLYYDDTPEDYEPPFFKCCAGNEAINIWNKNPLKMEVGNVNSKHLVLALKVKSVLDPCDDNNVNSADDGMSVDNESDHDDDFSDTEVRPSEAERYIVAPNDRKCKGQNTGTISEDDTQDAAHEEELTIQVKEWICSREIGTVNVPDVLSNFPDISMEMIEDIMERLLKDGVLSRASKDGYTINQTIDPKTLHIKEVIVQNVSPTEGTKQNNGDLIYMKALYHALHMDYVTIPKLQGKLDGEANHNMVQKLIGKMVQDGYVKNSANRRLGKAVIHSESNNRKFLEIKKILEGNEGEQMAIDTNAEHTECERKDLLKANEMRDCFTMGCLHSIGSDLTRTRELPELQQNVSMQSGQEAKDEELYHALPRDYMATAKLQGKMNGNLWSELKRSLRKMNKGHTLSKILGSLVGRRIFSTTSDNEGDTFKNFAVICLDGDAFKVLSSFVNAIVYYRFWNFSRGKSVDASPILDNNMKLYTVSPDGTFHFIVVYRNDIVDFVFDGIQAWFKGVIKEGNSFQFKSETDCNAYINPRLCGELSFDGKYHNIAPDTFPGKIPLGFEAIIDAFNEIKVFDGEETDKFRFALGTWVIFLGEAPKFHRVFLACCKSLVLEDISSLDSFDESLGLMVKKWGKLCDILMKHLIRALSGHSIPCLDEILEEITVRQVPKITTLRHILDNICLFNHNSARDRGSHPETSETKSSSETKSPPTSKNPVCCPIDFSSNQYAERIRKYCQGQLYGDTDEEVAKPNMKVNLSLGDHAFANDAVTAFVERRKAVIFSPSTWRSELPFKHHGISVPKETLIKNTTANAPVAKRNLLMNMSRSQTFSTFVKALKKFKL